MRVRINRGNKVGPDAIAKRLFEDPQYRFYLQPEEFRVL